MPITSFTASSDLTVSVEEAGAGRPALILHGGGGPLTVAGVGAHLATTMHALTPTHPGWNGRPRPDSVATVIDLARVYLRLLTEKDLRDVVVVGSSMGGWIAAEMALLDGAPSGERRIGAVVLLDAVGITVLDEPIRDFFALDARGVATYSWHDAERYYRDPALLTPEQAAVQRANMASLRAFAGDPYMHAPDLADRLSGIRIPTLVVWGDSDRIVTPAYGAAFAAAIPGARFELIAQAGHLPHLEQPEETLRIVDAFVADAPASGLPEMS